MITVTPPKVVTDHKVDLEGKNAGTFSMRGTAPYEFRYYPQHAHTNCGGLTVSDLKDLIHAMQMAAAAS